MNQQLTDSQEVVLYLGSSCSASSTNGNPKHLATPGQEYTECSRVEIDYNQDGEIHGAKSSPYRGPDRVLGRLCTKCLNEVQNQ